MFGSALAKYGYIEESPGGRGRQKPWRLTSVEQNLSYAGPDPEGKLASLAATEAFLDHELGRLKDRLRRADSQPEQWRSAGTLSGVTVPLTADELREASEALQAILLRHAERTTGEAPVLPGAREVRLFVATSVAPRPDERGTNDS